MLPSRIMTDAARIAILFFGLAAAECLAVEVPLPFDTELGRKYRAELEFVMVPQDRLPLGCFLARDIPGAPILPASTNPHATEDRELIRFVAALMGDRQPDLEAARVAITALYYDREPGREIGVWGILFADEAAATAMYESVVASIPRQRDRLVVKGPLLLTVWRDDGVRDESYDAVRAHIVNTEFAAPNH